MIVRKLDEQPFLNAAWFKNRRTFVDTDDPVEILADVLIEKSASNGRVGLDMNSYCMLTGTVSPACVRDAECGFC